MKRTHKKYYGSSANFIWVFVIFVLGNLLLLDYIVFKSIHEYTNVLGAATANDTCPKSCIAQFSQFSGSTTGAAKEYYVPLGQGTGKSDDWENVGAQASIDSNQYRRIKQAVFEVTVKVPTGNETVWVRLFNVIDKHPVWFSDVSMDGAGPTSLTSKPITLDPGSKIYQVQMKTQLKFDAQITQSRVHITTY